MASAAAGEVKAPGRAAAMEAAAVVARAAAAREAVAAGSTEVAQGGARWAVVGTGSGVVAAAKEVAAKEAAESEAGVARGACRQGLLEGTGAEVGLGVGSTGMEVVEKAEATWETEAGRAPEGVATAVPAPMVEGAMAGHMAQLGGQDGKRWLARPRWQRRARVHA
jgi:hypothetical protein